MNILIFFLGLILSYFGFIFSQLIGGFLLLAGLGYIGGIISWVVWVAPGLIGLTFLSQKAKHFWYGFLPLLSSSQCGY